MTASPVSSLWTTTDSSLHQALVFIDFAEAWAYMNAVAAKAEELDHHPDWSNSWNRVVIDLRSHDKGKVTARDHDLAVAADEALRAVLKPRATAYARTFAAHLIAARWAAAHAMLAPALAAIMSEADLRTRFTTMDDIGDPLTEWAVEDEFLLTAWPDRADNDLLWAYCSMWGKRLVEAVTVTITMLVGEPRTLAIGRIDFGRP